MNERTSAGFTLIEVVAVMVLLGLLVGTVALNTGSHGPRAHGVSSLLESHLLLVKEMAMTSRQLVGIRFDTERLVYEGVAIAAEENQTDPFRGDPLSIDVDVDVMTTNLPGNTVFFDKFGRPGDSEGNPLTRKGSIVIQAGGKQRALYIEPVTGYIHP